MDKLEQLTMQFNKRHPRFIDVTTGAKPRDAHTLFLDTMGLYSQWAVNTGLIKHRSDLKKLDMIDVKDIFTQRFGSADLPVNIPLRSGVAITSPRKSISPAIPQTPQQDSGGWLCSLFIRAFPLWACTMAMHSVRLVYALIPVSWLQPPARRMSAEAVYSMLMFIPRMLLPPAVTNMFRWNTVFPVAVSQRSIASCIPMRTFSPAPW